MNKFNILFMGLTEKKYWLWIQIQDRTFSNIAFQQQYSNKEKNHWKYWCSQYFLTRFKLFRNKHKNGMDKEMWKVFQRYL